MKDTKEYKHMQNKVTSERLKTKLSPFPMLLDNNSDFLWYECLNSISVLKLIHIVPLIEFIYVLYCHLIHFNILIYNFKWFSQYYVCWFKISLSLKQMYMIQTNKSKKRKAPSPLFIHIIVRKWLANLPLLLFQ